MLEVLPNDSVRIADETSLVITDLVVKLEDGSIANIEIQKIGYQFPGERCACYSSDLLLRQYKRVRSKTKKKFTYKHIKSVYTIILFEKSPREFHKFPKEYLHYFKQSSNTGLQMELLQKYIFIPLDIFRENQQNKDIKNKLDAWLVFLSMDSPEMIVKLIESYPEFKPMYEQIYDICQNIEEVMGMFSKELYELDRNTVQYMIDEMQEELDMTKGKLDTAKEELDTAKEELDTAKEELDTAKEELEKALRRIAELEQG